MDNEEYIADFDHLVPDVMLDAVEHALDEKMTSLATPLPSYINRVYEVQKMDGERLIAKFYRPDRWSLEAIEEEHEFVADCEKDEIPVIAPMTLPDGSTIGDADGIYFTIFPKRWGRQLELNSPKDWLRVGRLLGRIHVTGSKKHAEARTDLHPEVSTREHLYHLLDNNFVTPESTAEFEDTAWDLLDHIEPMFDDAEFIRIHGDCHCGNLLTRPGEGIVVIDFDDMMVGPPVHDLWLLLPDHADKCQRELDLLLRGYEMFREFDRASLRLIEPLRAMRIIYYLSWCSRQVDDYKFQRDNPDWGSNQFWQKEIADLRRQLQIVTEQGF
ncbi:stress response serine/threonine protein kinase YihE [bacterium E08(2017)]|nr:stress response serine/threonine protein kinase YihE [bacterium E08(2017)]